MGRITKMGTLLCTALLALTACASDTTAPVQAPERPALDVSAEEVVFGMSDVSTARAVHLEGFPCGLGPAGVTTDSRVTISSSGNATLICNGETPVGPPQTIVMRDFLCGVPGGGLTTDSHFVWTKSGQVTLVCQVKANG